MNSDYRLAIHEKLLELCPNVYFQPPANKTLTYPCIIYRVSYFHQDKANNRNYRIKPRFDVTIVSQDPNKTIVLGMLNLFEHVDFDRTFITDNLYHDILTLYYK